MIFLNKGIIIADVSIWQTIMFDQYGKLLPPEKQKHIDFNKMKKAGVSACVIKTGQDTYADPAFRISWENCKQAGLPRASYWFCDKDSTGKSQAKRYWDLIKTDPPEGFLSADLENGSWTNWNEWYNFINELQNLSGYPNDKIWVYSNYWYWKEHMPSTKLQREWFSKYPLWLAAYTDPSNVLNVLVPPEWLTCILWQNGTPPLGYEWGCWSREVDHNILNGGVEVFRKYFETSVTVPPDPIPTPITFPYTIRINTTIYKEENK